MNSPPQLFIASERAGASFLVYLTEGAIFRWNQIGFGLGTHVLSLIMLSESDSPNLIPRRDAKRYGWPLDEKPSPVVDGATSQFQCLKPSIDLANALILLIDLQSGLFQTVCDMLTPETCMVSPLHLQRVPSCPNFQSSPLRPSRKDSMAR